MPHARIRTSYDLGPEGRILIATTAADPAAGAEISITVPGRAVWEVRVLFFRFTTDATVATRRVAVLIDDGTDTFFHAGAAEAQTASDLFPYTWFHGSQFIDGDATGVRTPIPQNLTLLPGWRIRTQTTSLQAGDNYAAPVLYVREVPQRGIDVGQDALRSALRRLIGEEGFGG